MGLEGVPEDRDRRLIRPLQVIDHEQGAGVAGERLEKRGDALEEAVAPALGDLALGFARGL